MNWKKSFRFSINNLAYILHKQKYSKLMQNYKGKYVGQSCFIVGNGPSLRATDLDRIAKLGITSFAANKIYTIFAKTKWRPDFISVSDPQFIWDDTIRNNLDNTGAKMFFTCSEYYFCAKKNKSPTCVLYTNQSRKALDNPKFSEKCDRIIYDLATVTYFSIQLAAYMGFKDIYLIGMDNRYAVTIDRNGNISENTEISSWFEGYRTLNQQKCTPVATWEMDIAYSNAKKFASEHGFHIYNATRGGYLDTFDRKDLDAVLNEMEG